jgi:hypothetical protein
MKILAFIVFTICTVNFANAAELQFERGKFERIRFDSAHRKIGADIERANVADYDSVKRFRLPLDMELANAIHRLNVTYPNAYKNIGRIEDFSHFGELYKRVKAGDLAKEKFLKEYESYLRYYN